MCVVIPKQHGFAKHSVHDGLQVPTAAMFAASIDADEAAQVRAVVQSQLKSTIDQAQPVLREVHAQHALQSNDLAPALVLGIGRGVALEPE
nr:hypothetical protein [Comamonas sp. NLF-1-9]